MNIHRSGTLTFRAPALVSFHQLILNRCIGDLPRNGEKPAARLALLIAKASIGIILSAKDDG
jgi:hypothetical protein